MKSGLTKEYKYDLVDGTFNMKEIRCFFGSKVMKIEDIINVDDSPKTQYVSFNNLKRDNHKLILTQKKGGNISDIQLKLSSPDIILEIETTKILKEYLKGMIKKYEVFSDIVQDKTYYNSIDKAITEYIDENLLSRYIFSDIILYTKYEDLLSNSSKAIITELPAFTTNIRSSVNIDKRFQIVYLNQNQTIQVKYTMSKPFTQYNLEYYFDVVFKKK